MRLSREKLRGSPVSTRLALPRLRVADRTHLGGTSEPGSFADGDGASLGPRFLACEPPALPERAPCPLPPAPGPSVRPALCTAPGCCLGASALRAAAGEERIGLRLVRGGDGAGAGPFCNRGCALLCSFFMVVWR